MPLFDFQYRFLIDHILISLCKTLVDLGFTFGKTTLETYWTLPKDKQNCQIMNNLLNIKVRCQTSGFSNLFQFVDDIPGLLIGGVPLPVRVTVVGSAGCPSDS